MRMMRMRMRMIMVMMIMLAKTNAKIPVIMVGPLRGIQDPGIDNSANFV